MHPTMAVLLVACLLAYGFALLLIVWWVRGRLARHDDQITRVAAGLPSGGARAANLSGLEGRAVAGPPVPAR